MSLIKCPECGKEISDTALSCPSCGYNMKVVNYKIPISAKIFSFLVPPVGLIIYLLNIGKNEKLAKKCGDLAIKGIVTLLILVALILAIWSMTLE